MSKTETTVLIVVLGVVGLVLVMKMSAPRSSAPPVTAAPKGAASNAWDAVSSLFKAGGTVGAAYVANQDD